MLVLSPDYVSSVLFVGCDGEFSSRCTSLLREKWPQTHIATADSVLAALAAPAAREHSVAILDGSLQHNEIAELVRGFEEKLGSNRPGILVVIAADQPSHWLGHESVDVDEFLLTPFSPSEFLVRVSLAFHRNALARRQHEQALELQKLYERQSEFLSIVSHEIRTPLSAIMSSANILMRYGSKRPESVDRFGNVIYEEGRRLTRLINDLLDLAKIEAGQVEWNFTQTAAEVIIKQVQESFAALVGERNLRLDVQLCPNCRPVLMDRDKMTQVLANLVSNAIKYSPDGGTVRVRCEQSSNHGILLEVEDEGPGVPAGAEETIFKRFQQVDPTGERVGTGLGLTISREIVDHHGGRVWAVSGRSKGALFIVELPASVEVRGSDGPV